MTYPVITAFAWLLCEGLKSTRIDRRWFPFLSCLFGILTGGIVFLLAPTLIGAKDIAAALLGGGISGLAATGAYEAVKQFFHKTK